MQNKILLSIISIFVTFGLLYFVYILLNGNTGVTENTATMIKPADQIKWASKSKNLLIEYSDFQCPACKVFHDSLKEIDSTSSANRNIKENVTFVFRNYPLPQHINALKAAYAAEAAGGQNKFFEMSELLFNEVNQWENLPKPDDYFVNLAKKLNLDIKKFTAGMNSQEIKQKIQDDKNSGDSINLDHTPTFVLNGKNLGTIAPQELIKLLQNTAKQTK